MAKDKNDENFGTRDILLVLLPSTHLKKFFFKSDAIKIFFYYFFLELITVLRYFFLTPSLETMKTFEIGYF